MKVASSMLAPPARPEDLEGNELRSSTSDGMVLGVDAGNAAVTWISREAWVKKVYQ
jgi:hypothetical protein